MRKADTQPPKLRSIHDLFLIGKIRNPRDPLQGVIGAAFSLIVNVKDRN